MRGYQLFTLELDPTQVEALKQTNLNTQDYEQTRAIGDEWARAGDSLALKVPSVVVPLSYNYLINPNHSHFNSESVVSHGAFEYEERIVRLVEQAKTDTS